MKKILSSLLLSAILPTTALAADIALYPTGPAEDSSFVRFVNGGSQPVEVTAQGSNARLTLDAAKPASDFLPIAAGKPIAGTMTRGQASQKKVSATAQPGEFISLIALDDANKGLDIVTVREKPDDFNALKASVALYNLDAHCATPALKVAGRDIVLLDQVPEGQSKRRQINPVALSVQLNCGGRPVGQPLNLGTLVAGQRYTVFLVPAGQSSRIFYATDTVAH
ncbi:alginate O-acetyltransferase AlgF [Bordetella sp. FB-8]|uniref:alginate O-acetyltransferase AlgF n=1 Tax=Bordetella sp. FB-8 TaxID=1159870 RepID=UPI00036092EF|nr:alginate O-acetyltransferase AlgF [Bordetella sp. FB-8]